ncbi:MAG: thiol-activated cytolysin family protein [Myxococcota bacterium]
MRTAIPLLVFALLGCNNANVSIEDAGAYLNQLPDFPEAPEPFDRATEAAEFEYEETQVCSTTTYSIGDAPEEVVMFNADPQVFWPGALLEGDSYETGSPKLIPLPNRTPLNLSISGLYAQDSAAFDVEPSPSAVTSAINTLLSGAVRDEVPTTQSVLFQQQEAYSYSQSALALGFSARYLGASVSGALSYDTSSETNTVAANATIRTFTVSVDPPTTPSAFFDGLSERDLQEQVDLGRLSENNLPVYVSSVTYGQIMMFSASSTESMSDLKGALSASFNSFSGGGSVGLSAEQSSLLAGSSIKVVTLGGSEEGVEALIRKGDPSAFFRGSSVVTSSVPIGYTLKDLHGNIVKIGETAEYGLTTCSPNGFANVYVLNSGGNGYTSGYYPDGTRADLGSEAMGASTGRDIAHDSLNDRLYVLSDNGVVNFLDIFEADGSRPTPPVAHGGNDFSVDTVVRGLTYDASNARLYVIGDMSSGARDSLDLARGWTSDGYPLNLNFTAEIPDGYYYILGWDGIYDDANERLLVVGVVNGPPGDYGAVFGWDKRANPLPFEGTFEGLVEPRAIAVDASLDRIYVADEGTDRIHVFDGQGRTIDLANPIEGLADPIDLHFDPLTNRLYVLEASASLISAWEPDGTEALGLTQPQFPGINQPLGMTFRP